MAEAKMSRAALTDDIVTANAILYARGIVDGFGHVSVRCDNNPAYF